MAVAATTLTLEQHIYNILTPYRILAIQSGHVKENKEEDEVIYTILTGTYLWMRTNKLYSLLVGNIARVVRHRYGRAINDVSNVSIVSVVGETGDHRLGGICHGMIAVLMCTKNFTYKIVEARLTETKDWLGEHSKQVDEQMVVVLKEAVSEF
jgi:hypothetical protein